MAREKRYLVLQNGWIGPGMQTWIIVQGEEKRKKFRDHPGTWEMISLDDVPDECFTPYMGDEIPYTAEKKEGEDE